MIHIPTTADVRLMIEDEAQPIGEVVAMAQMFLRWGWTQAPADVVQTVAYIACHPRLESRMRGSKYGVELHFEPCEAIITVDDQQIQPWAMSEARMRGIMMRTDDDGNVPADHINWVSALIAARAIELWIKALRDHIDERLRSGEVVIVKLLTEPEVSP